MIQELKILHCVTDDKFIDSMIDLTQTFWEGCYHEYVFIYNKSKIEFKYIHKKELIKQIKDHEIIDYIQQQHFNVVILHNLYSIPYYDLVKIPFGIKVVWFAWGFDIYLSTYNLLRPLINKKLYYNKTKRYRIDKTNMLKHNLFMFISRLLKLCHYKQLKKAIGRIDYFSGVIPEEYDLIVSDKHNKHFRAKPLLFSYNSSIGMYNEENINNPIVSGYDIQVGNSGDPSNNHIDIMDELKRLNLQNKRVYCPISYSGTEYYCEKIRKHGEKLFGECFFPLTTFIPLSEYKKIISSTRYAIFAMERQQAMGNILIGLWEGRMVFLSENNPAYLSLKNKGYVIYTIQHDLDKIERNEIINDEELLINRKLLIKDYSTESEIKKAKDIIKILANQ